MKRTSSWRTAFSRGLAALTAVLIVGTMRPAHSSPGEIFQIAAPAITDAPPATAGIADGESGVSTSTGAFTYSYPIGAPPGRGEMRPSISLQYSSQAPIYGTLAAGWTLSGLPIITEESSGGRLWGTATVPSSKRFQSSLSGNRPLFVVNEASPAGTTPYRAQNDSSWLRYQYHPTGDFWWRALSPNGTSYYFGHKDAHTSGCTIVSRGYAPVTRIEDEFSNQIDFYYEQGVAGECRIRAITWGHNPVTGMNPFAAMLFTYEATPPCPGTGVAVGSQSSYRSGTMIVTGASQLLKIESIAYPPASSGGIAPPPPLIRDHTRTITLGYSSATASCSAAHAPYRALTSIQESAVGTDSQQVVLPEITFGYGDASVNYGAAQEPVVPWPATGFSWDKYNLGWGYRPPGTDAWPTVEAMMLDLDADGLVDRIVSVPTVDTNGRTTRCRAAWYRNLGAASNGSVQFAAASYIDIPTLKWATEGGIEGAMPYVGGAHAGDDSSTGANERCALNYQRSGYRNSSSSFQFSCPPNVATTNCPNQLSITFPQKGWCLSTKSDCGNKSNNQGDTHFAWRWMDMDGDHKPDLVGSPVTGGVISYDLQQGNLEGALQEPSIFGSFPDCPNGGPYAADPGRWPFEPYTMCGGMFPWFVYKNYGNGVFGEARTSDGTHGTWGPRPTEIIYQPIALETATGESSVTSRPVGQDQGTVDIDGDGFADAVYRDATSWKVYRNDGSGVFTPLAGGVPYVFGTGTSSFLSRTNYVAAQNPATAGVEGLEDFNGDGLVDHWAGTGSTVNLRYNDGLTFQTPAVSVDRPGPDGESSVLSAESKLAPSFYVCRGFRDDHRRTLDLDGDSRADLLVTAGGVVGVRYNAGGQFTTSSSTSLGQGGGFHRIAVETEDSFNPCNSPNGRWMTRQDFIDLDGDGVKEDVEFSSTGQMYLRPMTNTAPKRLLVSIDNRRGAITTIAYSSMNGPAVTQQPEINKASPTTGWVVQSVTTADSFSGTSSTTTYAYRRPNVGKDKDASFANRFAFRGFEEVTTTNPGPTGTANGSITIHRYGYDVDWSGRLVATIVKPSAAESATDVRTIATTTWQALSLFNGALKTYHPLRTEKFTCANGQTEATCTPAAAPGYVRTEISYTAYPDTPAPNDEMLWTSSRSLVKAAAADANGDRETLSTFTLAATPTTYQLRPDLTTRNHRVAGAMTLFGKSRSAWNPTTRELTEETWVDAVNSVISRSVLDVAGNVVQQWKPKQNAAGTTKTTLAYDARQLFAATVINELGHRIDATFEYGTGATLLSEGPNERTCVTGQSNCPADAMHPPKEQRKTKVDGLGRLVERWETASENGYVYELFQVETNSYVDAVAGSTPTSSTNYSRIDELANLWKQTKSELDGHGRPIKTIVYAQGTAPADHVTTYVYRPDGTLQTVSVPDPSANSAALVSYTYTFDSLGRPLTIRRPDSTTPSSQSGVNIAYNGVTQTTTEVAPSGVGGGQIGETQTINDKYGRLSQVREKTATSTWTTTNYGYGPDDLVTSIIDPQSNPTTLVHDFAGRRTQITRGTRTWKYGYDANGNMTSEVAPYAGVFNPVTELNHTVTVAYDDLDRNTSKLIGRRTLSDPDLLLFASGSEVFTWDTHFKGQLRYWQCYPPAADNPITMDLYSDGHGRRAITSHALSIAGYAPMTRSYLQQYYWNGNVRYSRYFDWGGVGGNETLTKTHFDARGLPSKIEMLAPQVMNLAVQTRNVAGLVTKRRTDLTGPMTFVESNWTYDKLGRVTNQDVMRNITPAQVAKQTLTYFGNDDVKTLQHFLGTASRTFTHTFDLRHQLTKVTTDTTSYFRADYTYGTAGRLTTAKHTRTLGGVLGADPKLVRNVSYNYAGADPEQVTSLTNVGGSTTYASYTYDAAGNQLTRSYPPTNELWEYTYDSKDQLRRVKRKLSGVVTGSEEYWYDAFGQRIAVVKRDAAGAKTELIWFIGDVQAHYNAAGAVTKVYSHLSLGTPVARVERTGATTSTLEFQFHGLASNTIAAVAQNGTINASFSYAPFGEVLEATNAGGTGQGTAVHKRRFNDKFEDDIGGLTYYGARFYDKTLLGWTQADPLYRFSPDAKMNEPRRATLYSFSLNNPLRFIDPTGLDSLDGYSPSSNCGPMSQQTDCMHKEVYGGETPYGRTPTKEGGSKRTESEENLASSRIRGIYGKKLHLFIGSNPGTIDGNQRASGKQLLAFFKMFVAPQLETKSGLELSAQVARGKTHAAVVWGKHGKIMQETRRDSGNSVISLDETSRSLDKVASSRKNPDVLLFHELSHHNRPTLREDAVYRLENQYRSERGIGPREQ